MASGRQNFFLATRTSSNHKIFLQSLRSQILLLWTILLWWRPAISHHSVLLIFRRSLLLRLYDHQISALCQAWTKSSWWNSKENNEFTLQKIVEATQKEKIKQATKSKTHRLSSKARIGPSNRRKTRVCRDPSTSDTLSHSDTDLAVPFADDSSVEDEEQDADCRYWTGRFLKTKMEKTRHDVQMYQTGVHTFCWYGGRFCL